jgi:hypothetical protein
VVERKIFASARNPTPGVHPVASYYTAWTMRDRT